MLNKSKQIVLAQRLFTTVMAFYILTTLYIGDYLPLKHTAACTFKDTTERV